MSFVNRKSSRYATRRSVSKYSKSYVQQSSGSRRHQFTADFTGPAGSTDATSLAANEYGIFDLARFQRTFDISVTADTEPTATASNNYQTSAVMNGSKIIRYQAKVRIENTGTSTNYYDVYTMALSFYDALIWDTVSTSPGS